MKNEPLPWTRAIPAQPGWYIIAAEIWVDDKSSFRISRYPIVGWTILEGDEYEGAMMCTPVSPISLLSGSKWGILTPDGSVHRQMTSDHDTVEDFIAAVAEELGIPQVQDAKAAESGATEETSSK